MNNQKAILNRIIVIILLVGNIFLGFKYFTLKKEVEIISQNQVFNDKVLLFTQLFIEKVLKTETEVNFETRLKLENLVRELNNEEILNKWQKFIESETEVEAQIEVKDLLQILVNSIKVNK
jgi:hypothetical protein